MDEDTTNLVKYIIDLSYCFYLLPIYKLYEVINYEYRKMDTKLKLRRDLFYGCL